MKRVKSNCVFQTIRAYKREKRRWKRNGSPKGYEPYIWFRQSRLEPTWILHFGYAYKKDRHTVMMSFVPIDPSPLKWYNIWKALYYEGHWVEGD